MGRNVFSRGSFRGATDTFVPSSGPATSAGHERVRETGKLDPLVDPAEYGVIRRSLVRFEERGDGLLELTVGCSMPIETRLDTTGSMGDNVDRALRVLPDLYELCSGALPGMDVHIATGIFGDCRDQFVLCRPQFEMEAPKIVQQLTLMHPEGGGAGNGGEDPHYGIFGGAYLVAAYVNCIGLKRYDFTVSDEPARYDMSEAQLRRIFGNEVFDKCKVNGFEIDPNDLPSTKEVIQDLLDQAHAFFLELNTHPYYDTHGFWVDVFGPERVVVLPRVELLPQVQAVIIGLTEGVISLDQVSDLLVEHKVGETDIQSITRSVANIPIGAQVPLRQAILESGHQIPKAGDVFVAKPDVFEGTNLWPIDPSEIDTASSNVEASADIGGGGPAWL